MGDRASFYVKAINKKIDLAEILDFPAGELLGPKFQRNNQHFRFEITDVLDHKLASKGIIFWVYRVTQMLRSRVIYPNFWVLPFFWSRVTLVTQMPAFERERWPQMFSHHWSYLCPVASVPELWALVARCLNSNGSSTGYLGSCHLLLIKVTKSAC